MNIISFVGAGPGARDLLTLRAVERLKKAEVLVWADSLVSPEIIELVPKDCEKIKTSSLTLEEILPILIDRNKNGKKIVRLHDGDPCLYGAISEQIQILAKSGIKSEIIPGISAYQATASRLNSELTIPGLVQTVILSRANGRTNTPKEENLEKLASTKATLCLYLSARHVEDTEKILLKHYDEDTLVAIAYRVSWKDEWIKVVRLKEMAKESQKRRLVRTTLYLISPALKKTKLRSKLYFTEHTHLFRPEIV
tara:strand:+ start:2075 stop:2833 length:759 start_codon:yes stop_codon:yes gene_type:complete